MTLPFLSVHLVVIRSVFARYRYRIEPTTAQCDALARQFGCCRVVFDDAIRVGESLRGSGGRVLDAEAVVQAVHDRHRAYRDFVDSVAGRRKGVRAGKPRFKSKEDTRRSSRLTRNGFGLRANGSSYSAKVGDRRYQGNRLRADRGHRAGRRSPHVRN